MQSLVRKSAFGLLAAILAAPLFGQTARVVEFPPPAAFYQNTTFAIDGNAGYTGPCNPSCTRRTRPPCGAWGSG